MIKPNNDVPVGAVLAYAGEISETVLSIETRGWMVCDGRCLSISEYPELFAAINYNYGGNGDFFLIPDLKANQITTQLSYIICFK